MAGPTGSPRDLAPAVTRSCQILDLLADAQGRPVPLTEIAAAIGAAKSSTFNLCVVLEENGLIQRRQSAGYTLGRRTVELGGAYIRSFDQLRDFHSSCLESPHLAHQLVKVAMLDGSDVLYLARHEGRAPFQFSASIGARFPAASTAVGNVLLSTMTDDEISARFSSPGALPRWTDDSVVDLPTLLHRVRRARSRGWAVEEGAVLPGVHSYAVVLPPANHHEAPLALGVSFIATDTQDASRQALLGELITLRDQLVAPFAAMRPFLEDAPSGHAAS